MTSAEDDREDEITIPFPVVVFTGYAGAGKTTAARMFRGVAMMDAEPGEYPWVVHSFANPLKEMLINMNPLIAMTSQGDHRLGDAIWLHGEEYVKNEHPEYRRLMQALGDSVKTHDPLFFARTGALNAAHAMLGEFSGVIFDDLRYPSELDILRTEIEQLGAEVCVIRIGAPDPSKRGTEHHSETSMDTHTPDYLIEASSLEELEAGVETVYERIFYGDQ